jgi:PleD family two-component response regulator
MSAGIATHEAGDDREGTALLDRAERALDDAKAGGRNRVTVFSPELRRWASTAA